MRTALILIVLFFGCGCGGGGGAGAVAPSVNAGADQSAAGPTITLTGNADATAVVWTQVSGPAPARFATPSAASGRVDLPLVGSYTFRLSGWRGSHVVADTVTITVTGTGTTIAGTVEDDAAAAAARVELQWRDGFAILDTATAPDGTFAVGGLAGVPGDYRIVVRGTP